MDLYGQSIQPDYVGYDSTGNRVCISNKINYGQVAAQGLKGALIGTVAAATVVSLAYTGGAGAPLAAKIFFGARSGAAMGMAFSGGFNAYSQMKETGTINTNELGQAVEQGFITGGISGLFSEALYAASVAKFGIFENAAIKKFVNFVAVEFTSGAVTSAATQFINSDGKINIATSMEQGLQDVGFSMLIGAVRGGIKGVRSESFAKAVNIAGPKVKSFIGKVYQNTKQILGNENGYIDADLLTFGLTSKMIKRAEKLRNLNVDVASVKLLDAVGDIDSVEITLRYKEGMPINEFNRKANALKELGDQGKLFKAQNPVARDQNLTKAYKNEMIRKIWNQYGKNNPEFANKLIDRIKYRMQPDHVWELQLGGPDIKSNLRLLDSFTNWDIGVNQIRQQIKKLPIGTKIKINIER